MQESLSALLETLDLSVKNDQEQFLGIFFSQLKQFKYTTSFLTVSFSFQRSMDDYYSNRFPNLSFCPWTTIFRIQFIYPIQYWAILLPTLNRRVYDFCSYRLRDFNMRVQFLVKLPNL